MRHRLKIKNDLTTEVFQTSSYLPNLQEENVTDFSQPIRLPKGICPLPSKFLATLCSPAPLSSHHQQQENHNLCSSCLDHGIG